MAAENVALTAEREGLQENHPVRGGAGSPPRTPWSTYRSYRAPSPSTRPQSQHRSWHGNRRTALVHRFRVVKGTK